MWPFFQLNVKSPPVGGLLILAEGARDAATSGAMPPVTNEGRTGRACAPSWCRASRGPMPGDCESPAALVRVGSAEPHSTRDFLLLKIWISTFSVSVRSFSVTSSGSQATSCQQRTWGGASDNYKDEMKGKRCTTLRLQDRKAAPASTASMALVTATAMVSPRHGRRHEVPGDVQARAGAAQQS